MTPKEQTRLQVLNSLLADHMTPDQAATPMGVSERHIRRILAACREEGAAAVAHGHRGRRPPNATPEPVTTAVVQPGSHQVCRGQPHPSQRAAERTRGHRYRQVYPAAYPGQRRTEQSSTKASAQAPGAPPAHAPGGHADPGGRQPSPVAGGPGAAIHAADRGGRCHWYCGRGPLLPAGRRPQLLPADAIPDRALRHTRCPVHRPARGIQAHTRLRPPWDAHPVQPGYGGAGGSR